jgi:2-polyprenyl-3-methyl-5-hydroxy-6-metoxy-1,4-benzoquinol methylase
MNNMNTEAFNPSYICQRPDIEALVYPDAKSVLDVGCSIGTLGAAIKAKSGAHIIGIELSEEMARYARDRVDEVLVGDAAEIILQGKLGSHRFDTIIFADVLEHLSDPWSVLRVATDYLAPNGAVIASIPNIRHIDTIYNLLIRGHWPYRDRGIHDRTHLRFFTKSNIVELFESAGLSIDLMKAHYRIIERPHDWNRFARFLALPGLRNFLAFQYLTRARLSKRSA